ncbi:NAD(P)/FAD-dependent oxidoreductase, partial [Salmonella enterica subsp. enterica serovar Lubbock]
MTDNIYDITIIGGGPAGLFAAFYAGMRQAKTKIIESLPTLGGQLSLLYPEKLIYDVAGFPNIKAQDLVDNLVKQIEPFKHDIHLEETVLSFDKKDEVFT